MVGEELSVPLSLLTQHRLDGLWNPTFSYRVRSALLGEALDGGSFVDTVRHMIDCRLVGFTDGAQVVNYLGSHDVEGFRNERLYNFLDSNGVPLKEERIKLAFVCLLTAMGIPMIFAGDEFADQHDLATRASLQATRRRQLRAPAGPLAPQGLRSCRRSCPATHRLQRPLHQRHGLSAAWI